MNRFVLDCSMAMTWFFEDEADPASNAVLDMLADDSAIAPALWPFELANVLVVAARHGRVSIADIATISRQVVALPIVIEPAPDLDVIQAVLAISREHNLSAYDAAYLELSIRVGLPLATRDDLLTQAARACGVAVLI